MDHSVTGQLLLLLLAVTATWSILVPVRQNFLDLELCMGCICEATSNCNLTFHCTRNLCGPFLISQIYWKEAGRPTLQDDLPNKKGAYIRCVTDPYCAASTVRKYLTKYAQDCDGNGIIDCEDYARIHYMGGWQCSLGMQTLGYYKVFKECHKSIRQLTG